jgi:ubiquinone/menaquinone biosynthesis C-methylase UbiE
VLFTNARQLGFKTGSFDIALCGFMGWDDCFDFAQLEFTRPDTKAKEIRRVLKDGGWFVCCSWDIQEDLHWMEDAFIRHYPAILEDQEYIERHPIGMANENADGYEIILRAAGFRHIEISTEVAEFISTDEEEWWRQMREVGWRSFFEKLGKEFPDRLLRIKEAIFEDLQPYKQSDGIHFTKSVFFVRGVK